MEIESKNGTVTITGNIKSLEDFAVIQQALDSEADSHKSITIKIVDSLSLTSSVIGYLNKLVQGDGIRIELHAGSGSLLALLDDLGLTQLFNARRILA